MTAHTNFVFLTRDYKAFMSRDYNVTHRQLRLHTAKVTAVFNSGLGPVFQNILSLETDLSSLITLATIAFSMLKIKCGLLTNWPMS